LSFSQLINISWCVLLCSWAIYVWTRWFWWIWRWNGAKAIQDYTSGLSFYLNFILICGLVGSNLFFQTENAVFW